jgi:hypothetical protein
VHIFDKHVNFLGASVVPAAQETPVEGHLEPRS